MIALGALSLSLFLYKKKRNGHASSDELFQVIAMGWRWVTLCCSCFYEKTWCNKSSHFPRVNEKQIRILLFEFSWQKTTTVDYRPMRGQERNTHYYDDFLLPYLCDFETYDVQKHYAVMKEKRDRNIKINPSIMRVWWLPGRAKQNMQMKNILFILLKLLCPETEEIVAVNNIVHFYIKQITCTLPVLLNINVYIAKIWEWNIQLET